MKKLFLLCIILSGILTSCGGPKAFYDYKEDADFQGYKEFSFYDELNTDMQEFDQQRFKQSLDTLLKQKGLTDSGEDPDFKIDFFADYFKSDGGQSNVGVSIGGLYGNMPVGGSELYISITVNFIDVKKDELYWQGVVEASLADKLNPQERAEFFKKLAKKVLSKYPPEK